MTNEELKQQFTVLYPILKTYTDKALSALRSSLDYSHVLSECYLYLNKIIDKIEKIQDVEPYAKQWIKQNIKWTRSPINIQNSIRPNHSPDYFATEHLYAESPVIDSDQFIFEWESKLTSIESRVWLMYYYDKLDDSVKISKHLNISVYFGNKYLKHAKQLESSLREYIKIKLEDV